MEKGIKDFKIQTDKELELFDKVIMIMARANGAIILSKILNRGISCLSSSVQIYARIDGGFEFTDGLEMSFDQSYVVFDGSKLSRSVC